LWNQELMKTETKYEMERQSITYKMLKLYQPKEKVQSYTSDKNEKISEQDRWLFYFLWRIDKTLRTDENAQNVLEGVLADEKFVSIFTVKDTPWKKNTSFKGLNSPDQDTPWKKNTSFKNLNSPDQEKSWKKNTYDIFSKLWFMWVNWCLNLKNIEKFKVRLDKVSSTKDCERLLPKIEWFDWEYENKWGTVKLIKKKEEDLFSALDRKFPNTKKIEF